MGAFLVTHAFHSTTPEALVIGQMGSGIRYSLPWLLSDSLLHSDGTWMVTLGPVIGVPMTWQTGMDACMTPSGPFVTTYMVITQLFSLLVLGGSCPASTMGGFPSAHSMASSSIVLGVIGTHIFLSFRPGQLPWLPSPSSSPLPEPLVLPYCVSRPYSAFFSQLVSQETHMGSK